MIKAVKILNLFSTLFFMIILGLVYAYLPISVNLNVEGTDPIHKHRFFYYTIATFVVMNIIVRTIISLGFKSAVDNLATWMSVLIFILNFYLTLLIGFVGVWNNATHIDPANYAYLNVLGPIFVLFWVGGLFYFFLKRK